MTPRAGRGLLLVAALAACGPPDDSLLPPAPPHIMPDLRAVPIGAFGQDQVADLPHLSVDVHGGITYSVNTPGGDRLIRIDSSGRRTATFGPTGPGRGEFAELAIPFAAGDTVLVFDTARLVFARFLLDGRLLSETAPVMPRIPLQVIDDSVDEYSVGHEGPLGPGAISRRPLAGEKRRQVLTSDDSLLRLTVGTMGRRVPVWTSRGPINVLGDPIRYRLYFLRADGSTRFVTGRNVPPNHRGPLEQAERRAELDRAAQPTTDSLGRVRPGADVTAQRASIATDTTPHFLHPGVQFDRTGRLWVIGTTGDSTFADVFADSTFLGRRMLPCLRPTSVSLHGDWLALGCIPHDPGTFYRLLLYRIEER